MIMHVLAFVCGYYYSDKGRVGIAPFTCHQCLLVHGSIPFCQLLTFPVLECLKDFNQRLSRGDCEGTFSAMKEVIKLVDDTNMILFHSYAKRYLEALRLEQKEGIPSSILVRGHCI